MARSHAPLSLLTLSAALLVGCTGSSAEDSTNGSDTASSAGALTDGFAVSLTHSTACSDTSLYAWDDADQLGLELSAPGVLAEARTGGLFEIIYDFALEPAASLTVEVTKPDQASMNYCVDVVGHRDILATYTPTAGTVTLAVTAEGDSGGHATASFNDVVLTDTAGHTVQMGRFDMVDVYVSESWGG